MCYNSTQSTSTGKSPHEIVYGIQLRTPTEALLTDVNEELMPTVEAHLQKLKTVQDIVIKQLQEARDRQKNYADTKRREETFQIGD